MTATDEIGAEFTRLTAPYRGELQAYCYRMLGSLHDAEDLVQEVYLRAWRSYGEFEGRAALRTWLYRIATNACLTALKQRGRRVLPADLRGPAEEFGGRTTSPEVLWLQPFPDDPAAVAAARAGVRLAFVAALQHLPPRQRAVLVLRDVLGWSAAETAGMLGVTATAVNSALQRAHDQMERLKLADGDISEPTDSLRRTLLDRYVAAFEQADVGALAELFTTDVTWQMPPIMEWYEGHAAVVGLIAARGPKRCLDCRLLPTRANGQPAFGYYTRSPDGTHGALSIQVLTVTEAGISGIMAFHELALFPAFGLPTQLP